MKKSDVVAAWRDQDAFESLSDEEKMRLPANPAGMADLNEELLEQVSGGGTHYSFCEPTASWCDDCGGSIDLIAR